MNEKHRQKGKSGRYGILLRFASLFVLAFLLLPLLFACAPAYSQIHSYGMGTYAVFTVEDKKEEAALLALFAQAENDISFRREFSFIAKLNRGEEVLPSKELAQLLEQAALLQEQTGGRFSVLSQKETSLWNFDAEHPTPPDAALLKEAVLETAEAHLTKQANGAYLLSGGGIDLGAAGKGYATDILAAHLKEKGQTGLIAVGGSIACLGKKTGDWSIGVRDPFSANREDLLGTLSLREGFISTSGSYEKCFFYDGKEYHHILDAKTGYPVQNELISVTVLASGGALADMLSTAAFILGLEEGFALCGQYGAEAIFVCKDGSVFASSSLLGRFTPRNVEVLYR